MVENKVFQQFISQSADGAAQNVSIKKEWRHENVRVGLLISYDYLGLEYYSIFGFLDKPL